MTQEAFLRVFRKLSTFRGEAAFETWLHGLVANVAAVVFFLLTAFAVSQRMSPARRASAEAAARHPRERDGQKVSRSRWDFVLRLVAAHLCEGFLVIRFGAKALKGAITFHLIGVVEAFLHGRLQGS